MRSRILVAGLVLSAIMSFGAESNQQFRILADHPGIPSVDASIAFDGQACPTIPVLTQFGYWNHHWFAWLPQHPVYEAVEVMLIDSPEVTRKVIWVYFTERLGSKSQDHYLNDPELVKRWSGRPYYREVEYKTLGEPGSPLGIHLRFQDKDNAPVELDFKPMAGSTLRAAGLTRSAGHATSSIFHLFYRDKDSLLGSSLLLIGGKFVRSVMPSYSSGIYPIIFSYGKAQFDCKDSAIVNSWGRTFTEVSQSSGLRTFRSAILRSGWDNAIEVVTDGQGNTVQYKHRDRDHYFQINFTPGLPIVSALSDGQRVKYEILLDNKIKLVDGMIEVSTSKQPGSSTLRWLHESPDWAKDAPFRTTIQVRSGENIGYDLLVQRDQR